MFDTTSAVALTSPSCRNNVPERDGVVTVTG
jgi:hypothetical protein